MPTLGKKMKVAVYYRNNDVRLEERPIPEIGAKEILVKTEACGLCGGETMEWYLAPRAPKILGHEPGGVVIRTGKEVKRFNVGDRVFVHHHVPCMSCHFCQRGFFTMCAHYKETGIDPGGFAEYFRVPAENVKFDTLLLPENVSFKEAAIIEPMACTLKGIKQTQIHYGDTVVIVGMGLMGMSYLELLKLSPAGKIIATDFSEWRLKKALGLGATHVINPDNEVAVDKIRSINNGLAADVVIVTVPNSRAWQAGLDLCEKGASIHFGAPPPPDMTMQINPNWLYFNEIKINSSYSASHVETSAVLDLITSRRVNAKALITHEFGLDKVQDAIQLLLAADKSLKTVICPSMTN